MEKTKTLSSTAILMAIAVIISIILYILPIFQFALFLVGVPIVILGYKTDIKVQLLVSIGLIFMTSLLDPAYAMTIGFIVLPLSILQGYLMHNNKNASETIFISGLGMVFGFIVFLYSINMMFNIDIITEMTTMLDQSIVQVRSFYETMNTLSTAELNEMFTVLTEYKSYMVLMMPAMIILSSFISSTISFLISRKILMKMGEPIKKTYFKDFRIQGQGRMVLMIVLGVVTIVSIIDKSSMEYYVLNFMSVFTLIMQINGLAFIWYLSEKHPNKVAMRVIIVIMVILSSVLGAIAMIMRFVLGLLGFTDMYMNFRNKIESRKK